MRTSSSCFTVVRERCEAYPLPPVTSCNVSCIACAPSPSIETLVSNASLREEKSTMLLRSGPTKDHFSAGSCRLLFLRSVEKKLSSNVSMLLRIPLGHESRFRVSLWALQVSNVRSGRASESFLDNCRRSSRLCPRLLPLLFGDNGTARSLWTEVLERL